MEQPDLYNWMNDSSLLTEETLSCLEKSVADYPWASSLRMLYLKNLALTGGALFEEEVKKHAIYIPDRRKLYNYIYHEMEIEAEGDTCPENSPADDPFLLIDSFLTSQGTLATYSPGAPLPIQPSVSSDYLLWAYSHPQTALEKQEEQDSVPLKHQELIDSFLIEEENRPPGARFLTAEEEEANMPAFIVEDEEYEKTLDDSYFTETLARIYVKQKRYEKALQIIKKLSLKYPEKNIYFADQMRFLEKLIINTKK